MELVCKKYLLDCRPTGTRDQFGEMEDEEVLIATDVDVAIDIAEIAEIYKIPHLSDKVVRVRLKNNAFLYVDLNPIWDLVELLGKA